MRRIASGRGEVVLHPLSERRSGPNLLALHALGGGAADFAGLAPAWPGPVWALDLPGHGASAPVRGGSYTPELLAADADAALHALGDAHVVGSGLGAYVALLLAGARPGRVAAALLLPGRGFVGGGTAPDFTVSAAERNAPVLAMLEESGDEAAGAFDALVTTCERDPRPPEYARAYADAARRLLLADPGDARPPWWEAVRAVSSATTVPAEPAEALGHLASA